MEKKSEESEKSDQTNNIVAIVGGAIAVVGLIGWLIFGGKSKL